MAFEPKQTLPQAKPSGSIAIVAMFRDEAQYIGEWLLFHHINGVSRFVLFNDGSTDNSVENIVRVADKHGIDVSIHQITIKCEFFEQVQKQVYRSGFDIAQTSCEFVAFIDIDEFIFCHNLDPLYLELSSLHCDISAIAVNQRVFGSGNLRSYEKQPVTSRFVMCTELLHAENQWVKSIVRTNRLADITSAHSVTVSAGRYVMSDSRDFVTAGSHPGQSDSVGIGNIRLNHYMTKSWEEYQYKRMKWTGRYVGDRYTDDYFNDRNVKAWANNTRDDLLTCFEHLLKQN